MVAYYGMSPDVGTHSYYGSTGRRDMSFPKPYSEQTAQRIDAEAKRLIAEAYAMAEKVIKEHAAGLKELAELLLSREVVFTEDVERIFGKRKKDIERERREAAAKTAGAAAPGSEPAGQSASAEPVVGMAAAGKPAADSEQAAGDAAAEERPKK